MPRPTGYMPQLDSLRTFAVLLVVIYHWFPTGEGINWLPNGTIGVMIFFVISGFLITRILLESRHKVLAKKTTLGKTYRNFFIRRALRIFPLYYLVITAVFLFLPQIQRINPDIQSDIRQYPLYYYLYGYNILLHQTGNWADLLSPFWTLGVEEQLYLVWPWVVLLLPTNRLSWAIGGLIVLGIGFRAYGYTQGDLDGVLTPASLDAFGLGACLAYLVVERPNTIDAFLTMLPKATLVALVTFALLLALPDSHLLVVMFQRLMISILALYVVVWSSIGFRGIIGAVLNNSALQYVGRISYGIYVFHMIVPGLLIPLVLRVLARVGHAQTLGYWSHRIISFVLLLVVASASWYLFEKPINSLKRYFQTK